jgi:hypothetical protein
MIQTGQSGIRAYVLADIVYPIGNADPPSRGSVFLLPRRVVHGII